MKNKIIILLLATGFWACNKAGNTELTHSHGDDSHTHSNSAEIPEGQVDILEKTVIPATSVSPEYIQLANNVEIISNINDAVSAAGVLACKIRDVHFKQIGFTYEISHELVFWCFIYVTRSSYLLHLSTFNHCNAI